MAKLVAKVYADALFEVALSKGMLDEVYEEIVSIRDIFSEHNELKDILKSPMISAEDKKDVIKNLFSDRLSSEVYGLILQLIEKHRQSELMRVCAYLIDEIKEYKKIGKAYIISAYELGADERKSIEDRLLATTAYESFEFVYNVDESLIGGLSIRIKDRLIDASLKSRLMDIRKSVL